MRAYLKSLRESLNLTQQDVAQKIKVQRQYYTMIENGNRQKSMDLKTMSGLAEVFNVSIEYIVQQEQQLRESS